MLKPTDSSSDGTLWDGLKASGLEMWHIQIIVPRKRLMTHGIMTYLAPRYAGLYPIIKVSPTLWVLLRNYESMLHGWRMDAISHGNSLTGGHLWPKLHFLLFMSIRNGRRRWSLVLICSYFHSEHQSEPITPKEVRRGLLITAAGISMLTSSVPRWVADWRRMWGF